MRPMRSLVFLLPLAFVCACEVTSNDRLASLSGGEARSEAVNALKDAAQFKHHAWTLSVASDGYRETNLWVNGNDLFAQVQVAQDDHTQTEVHAIDLASGTHRWTLRLPGELDQPPAVSSNRVGFICGSHAIIVNRTTGGRVSEGLSYELPSWPSARPALTDETLYVPTYIDNRLMTVDLNRGFSGWSYHTRGMLNAAPLIAGQGAKATLVLVTSDGLVADLPTHAASAAAPRTENWTGHSYGPNVIDPVTAGDLVFVASNDGSVYAFNHLTGTITWRYLCGQDFRGEVAVAKDLVFVCTASDLHAIDMANGNLKWQAAGIDRFVVRQDNRVIVHGSDGSYRVLEASDGKEIARFESPLIKNVAVNQDGNLFIFGDGGGTFYAFAAERPMALVQPGEGNAEAAKPAAAEGEKAAKDAEEKSEEQAEEKSEESGGESEKPADSGDGN